VIRAARPTDYEQLSDIERRAGEMFRDAGMPEIADHDPLDADELASADALFVATAQDGELVGYAMVELVEGHAHLGQISVLPEHGGQGVGTQLLDAVADWAQGQGHREITLTTFRDLPFNAPLYSKRGYEVVPDSDWTAAIRDLVAGEAEMGLDPAARVVMRRLLE